MNYARTLAALALIAAAVLGQSQADALRMHVALAHAPVDHAHGAHHAHPAPEDTSRPQSDHSHDLIPSVVELGRTCHMSVPDLVQAWLPVEIVPSSPAPLAIASPTAVSRAGPSPPGHLTILRL